MGLIVRACHSFLAVFFPISSLSSFTSLRPRIVSCNADNHFILAAVHEKMKEFAVHSWRSFPYPNPALSRPPRRNLQIQLLINLMQISATVTIWRRAKSVKGFAFLTYWSFLLHSPPRVIRSTAHRNVSLTLRIFIDRFKEQRLLFAGNSWRRDEEFPFLIYLFFYFSLLA